jgi:hypothetical protein
MPVMPVMHVVTMDVAAVAEMTATAVEAHAATAAMDSTTAAPAMRTRVSSRREQ